VNLVSKLVMTFIVRVLEVPFYFAASMILLPFRASRRIETIVILIIFPIIVNVIVLWVTDSFIIDPMHHVHDKYHEHVITKKQLSDMDLENDLKEIHDQMKEPLIYAGDGLDDDENQLKTELKVKLESREPTEKHD